MRNRRGSEKECSQNFWGEENPRKSLQFLGPSEPFPPPARGVLCSFTPVSLLPAAPHPPAAGQGSGQQPRAMSSSWGRGARGVKDALQPWRPKTLPEHPHQRALAILLCCTCRNGGSCLEKLRFLASCSIYTSENSATSQKSGVDTNNVFSYRKQNQLFSFN